MKVTLYMPDKDHTSRHHRDYCSIWEDNKNVSSKILYFTPAPKFCPIAVKTFNPTTKSQTAVGSEGNLVTRFIQIYLLRTIHAQNVILIRSYLPSTSIDSSFSLVLYEYRGYLLKRVNTQCEHRHWAVRSFLLPSFL